MIQRTDIPDMAICPACGQPMKVIDLAKKAADLGIHVPEGGFTIECCGGQLYMEDEEARIMLRDLLLAYHTEHNPPDDQPVS